MKRIALVAALLAFALTACGKKAEAPAPAPVAPAPAAAYCTCGCSCCCRTCRRNEEVIRQSSSNKKPTQVGFLFSSSQFPGKHFR